MNASSVSDVTDSLLRVELEHRSAFTVTDTLS